VLIRGTLAHPSVALDARESLAQTGKALTLGIVLTPLEVLGFVDPGLAKDADCAALLAEAKTDGVPVNAGAPAR
jgi:AsmA family protein